MLAMDIAKIAEQLERVGYIILDKPFLAKSSAHLFARCHENDQRKFKAARVGRGGATQEIRAIRGDVIRWLDDADHTDHAFLVWMEQLRLGLNEALFLGLFDYECHYAIYGAGSGYARHSDVLSGSKTRLLSTVFYLNEHWRAQDGGELVLFEPSGDTPVATVTPIFGRMIIFLSGAFPHQVQVSHHTRRSIAGWFSGSAVN